MPAKKTTEKIHAQIHAETGLRVAAASQGKALLVSDTARKVYRLPVEGHAFRIAWYEAILSKLKAGEKPTPSTDDYRQYAR